MSGKQTKRRRIAALKAEAESVKPVVVKFIREAVDKLRQEYARRLRIIRRNDPDGVAELGDVLTPCETCAFRRNADFSDGYDGFLQTSCLVVHALDTGAVFYCHELKVDGKDYRLRAIPGTDRYMPCIGWLTLQSPIPGAPLDVRELLGATVVETLVEGSRILNPERHRLEATR